MHIRTMYSFTQREREKEREREKRLINDVSKGTMTDFTIEPAGVQKLVKFGEGRGILHLLFPSPSLINVPFCSWIFFTPPLPAFQFSFA